MNKNFIFIEIEVEIQIFCNTIFSLLINVMYPYWLKVLISFEKLLFEKCIHTFIYNSYILET